MAQDLPLSKLDIRSAFFRYGRPLLSGEDSVDHRYGIRGLSSQVNHGYAYRVHVISSFYPLEAFDTEFFSTAAAGAVDATGEVSIELGANVKYLAVQADVSDAVLTLTTTLNGAGPVTPTVVGRSVATSTSGTLTDQTGATVRVKVQLHNSAGGTAKIFSYCIYEVALVAADIP